MRGHRLVSVLVLSAVSAPALASGYGLREHSAESMGAAYAGAAASGGDASYMAFNPASLSEVENGDAAVSVIGLFPHSNSSYPTSLTSAGTPAGGGTHPTGFVNQAIVPAIAARQRINDRWAVGLSVNVPWGLKTEYPGDWAGRYYALKTRLTVATVTPIVSYQVTPAFASPRVRSRNTSRARCRTPSISARWAPCSRFPAPSPAPSTAVPSSRTPTPGPGAGLPAPCSTWARAPPSACHTIRRSTRRSKVHCISRSIRPASAR